MAVKIKSDRDPVEELVRKDIYIKLLGSTEKKSEITYSCLDKGLGTK